MDRLKPSLLEKLWWFKPNSCEEIKRYKEMTSRARHEEWVMRVDEKKHRQWEVTEWTGLKNCWSD